MRYVPPVLIQYRYRILALLSLLLILEMVAVAVISSVPAEYEYEWVFGWTLLITMVAWTGIAGVIGVGAPVGSKVLKRGGDIILILSSALFATFLFSPILGAILFQSAFLADLFWQPHLLLFVIVWIGIVVIFVAAIPDTEHRSSFKTTLDMSVVLGATSDAGHSRKIYLLIGVFPLSVVAYSGIISTAIFSMVVVVDLLESLLYSLVSIDLLFDLLYFLGVLFILLSTFLIGAVVLRSTFVALGISIVVFVSAIFIGVLLFFLPYSGDVEAPPVSAISFIAFVPVLWSLTISVFGTMLIGTMRRPTQGITVAGVGMVAMTLALVWYLHFTDIWVIFW